MSTNGSKTVSKTAKSTAPKNRLPVEDGGQHLVIEAPKSATAIFEIEGTAPYVQHAFSRKAQQQIADKQKQGSTAKKGKKREPKDFTADYEAAKHVSSEGWYGIPASAFRNAMVSACRLVGFQMTRAKLALSIQEDGYDRDGSTPLVRITKGEPEYHEAHVQLSPGVVDIRARPMWKPGWRAQVQVKFDCDQFTAQDVANLLMRVGLQVGIGEGRPDSRTSCGCGWGTFRLVEEKAEA